ADQRIRERVRDRVCVEQRRHLRLAAEAGDALADVEHEVPALAGDEPGRERADVADPDDLVAERLERARHRVDGRARIELGDLDLGEAGRAVVVLEIVREADPEPTPAGAAPRAGGRRPRCAVHVTTLSAPSVPSGSG